VQSLPGGGGERIVQISPSDRAAGLSPFDAAWCTSYINYRIMSHKRVCCSGRTSTAPSSATGAATWSGPRIRRLCEACCGLLFELDGQAVIAAAVNADDVLSTGHSCAKRTSPTRRNMARRNTEFDQYLGGSVEIQSPARAGKPLGKPGNRRRRPVSGASIRKANIVLC
jgi:hypothetical protein